MSSGSKIQSFLLKHVRVRVKQLGLQNSLVVMDVFKAHFTGEVSAAMLVGHIRFVKVTCLP